MAEEGFPGCRLITGDGLDYYCTGAPVTGIVHRISTIVYSTGTPVSPSVMSTLLCMYTCMYIWMHITIILHNTMRGTLSLSCPSRTHAQPSWRSSRPRPTGL